MPSVAEDRFPMPSAKKRRRDGDDVAGLEASQRPFALLECPKLAYTPTGGHPFPWATGPAENPAFFPALSAASTPGPHDKWRRIIPMPSAKRARVVPSPAEDAASERTRRAASKSPTKDTTSTTTTSTTTATATRPTLESRPTLAPCHICHRRPTKKSDLDSFADCHGCGSRTCFVCIRQCKGWSTGWATGGAIPSGGGGGGGGGGDESCMEEDSSVLSEQEVLSRSFHMDDAPREDSGGTEEKPAAGGTERGGAAGGWAASGHRGMVCSRCCIEMGSDGEIACLGCLSRMEGT